jgi:hypothetical protein
VSDEGAGTAVVTFAGHFMIAVSDTSAFTSGLKLNADASLSMIMDAVAAAKPCGERRTGFGTPGSPRTTLDGYLRLPTATKRELDVALRLYRAKRHKCRSSERFVLRLL